MITMDNRGYALIEVVVIIVIIAFVTTIAFIVAGGDRPARFGQDVDELAANLRQLQSDARAAKGNDAYGICFESDGWTSFALASDATDDPCPPDATEQVKSTDFQVASLDASVSDASNWIVFERVTGRTRSGAQATLTLRLSDPQRSRTLQIDPNGAVHEQ